MSTYLPTRLPPNVRLRGGGPVRAPRWASEFPDLVEKYEEARNAVLDIVRAHWGLRRAIADQLNVTSAVVGAVINGDFLSLRMMTLITRALVEMGLMDSVFVVRAGLEKVSKDDGSQEPQELHTGR